MAIYLVSYDLNHHDRDYPEVTKILRAMRAVKCLYSEWLLESDATALEVANQVLVALDVNDRLLVVEVGSSAYRNLLNEEHSVALLQDAVS